MPREVDRRGGSGTELAVAAAGVTANEADCISSRFMPARLGTGGLGPHTVFLGGGFNSSTLGSLPGKAAPWSSSLAALVVLLFSVGGIYLEIYLSVVETKALGVGQDKVVQLKVADFEWAMLGDNS